MAFLSFAPGSCPTLLSCEVTVTRCCGRRWTVARLDHPNQADVLKDYDCRDRKMTVINFIIIFGNMINDDFDGDLEYL